MADRPALTRELGRIASVGVGSLPVKPPMAITGWPVASSIEPACMADETATIQRADPRFATR